MGLHKGHRARKKHQFLTHGLESFADHEVLEMLLFYAIPRRDTNETAHLLLNEFGSLKGVLDADAAELQRISGVGENAVALLKLIPALWERMSPLPQPAGPICDSDEAGEYLVRLFDGENKEILYLMCLDAKGKLLSCPVVATGGVNMAEVSVRRVIDAAIRSGAATVVLAHNHPSGIALPSRADQHLTKQVADILRPLGIRLMDHIVVADGDFVSMADSGTPMG